jgi:hypothetical protein
VQPQQVSSLSAEDSTATMSTVLPRHWLLAARLMWGVTALLSIGTFAASIPARFTQLSTVSVEGLTRMGQLTPADARAIAQLGLATSFYAGYIVTLEVVAALGFVGVAAVIVWHKSDDWMALLVALTLIMLGVVSTPPITALVAMQSAWQLLPRLMRALLFICFYLFFYLFPDGRFIPRWTCWLAAMWTLYALIGLLVPALVPPISLTTAETLPDILVNVWLLCHFGIAILAQTYRYRRASTPLQRQQTKWIVFGILAVALAAFGAALPILSFSWLRQPSVTNIVYRLVGVTAVLCSFILFATAIGIAILRHRLYDIDVLINRTLVYGALTVVLGLVYVGLIVLLQQLVVPLIGRSDVAIVASTLAIAALFTPLRRRIQTIIDRRFYRRKYDAAKVLAAFGATARDATDLEQLTAEMLWVVDETVQPEFVGVWLAPQNESRG